MNRVVPFVIALLGLCACTNAPVAPQPVPITPGNETRGAAVVRLPIPEPAQPKAPSAPQSPPGSAALADIVVPPNTQYVCVSEANGVRQQTSIEFAPKVATLCMKHPEMGPCKYEREICRKSNGRVYTANGVEITRQTEAEYDKKVLRVTFKAN